MTRFKWALTKHICRTDKLSGLIRDKTKKVRLGKKKQCTLLVDFPGYLSGLVEGRFSSWHCLPFRVVAVFEQAALHPMEGGTTYLPLGCDNDQVMLRNCYRKPFSVPICGDRRPAKTFTEQDLLHWLQTS